ncbi:hypothetical protein ACFLUG_02940 [Chloroflexota bacterium]
MKYNFPVKAIITYTVLVIVGVVVTVTAGSYATGYERVVVANLGSAIFGGSLAFFLVEMFRWDRERIKDK